MAGLKFPKSSSIDTLQFTFDEWSLRSMMGNIIIPNYYY